MKSITEYTEEELKAQREVSDHILGIVSKIPYKERWDINERGSGYAHYNFVMKPSKTMID